MLKRGHKITKGTGETLANDLRNRRFKYTPQRAHHNRGGSGDNTLRHVKTNSTCAARNISTGAMASVSCSLYIVAADGTLTDSGYEIDVFNPGGAIASGTWMTILLNEAGQYEFVVPSTSTFDVRVKPDGTALQKSTDGGSTWTDWATIGAC